MGNELQFTFPMLAETLWLCLWKASVEGINQTQDMLLEGPGTWIAINHMSLSETGYPKNLTVENGSFPYPLLRQKQHRMSLMPSATKMRPHYFPF